MAINVAQLQGYMGAGMNVFVSGFPGTGKTAMLKEAAANLGWNMKYFSTPTLDVFADLRGIPAPKQEKGNMEYNSDPDIMEPDVI